MSDPILNLLSSFNCFVNRFCFLIQFTNVYLSFCLIFSYRRYFCLMFSLHFVFNIVRFDIFAINCLLFFRREELAQSASCVGQSLDTDTQRIQQLQHELVKGKTFYSFCSAVLLLEHPLLSTPIRMKGANK